MERFLIGFLFVVIIVGVFYITASKTPEGVERSASNIEYREVCIEGKLFYATQTYYNHTTLAGPIKDC